MTDNRIGFTGGFLVGSVVSAAIFLLSSPSGGEEPGNGAAMKGDVTDSERGRHFSRFQRRRPAGIQTTDPEGETYQEQVVWW